MWFSPITLFDSASRISFSCRISPEIPLFFLKCALFTHGKSVFVSIGVSRLILLIGLIFMMQMTSFKFEFLIRLLELISVPNKSRDSFILFKLNTLCSWKEYFGPNCSLWYNSTYWTYLSDADGFLQFRVLIRLLDFFFVPNQSRSSFILFKLNTFYTWEECVRVNWSLSCNFLNWTYLYDADVLFKFEVMIRLLELISVPNQSIDS